MHKIKQTIFLNSTEVKEYELSLTMVGNPIYITEEDNFLVPRFGSILYYELSNNKREILILRDLVARNTIAVDTCNPPDKENEKLRQKIEELKQELAEALKGNT